MSITYLHMAIDLYFIYYRLENFNDTIPAELQKKLPPDREVDHGI